MEPGVNAHNSINPDSLSLKDALLSIKEKYLFHPITKHLEASLFNEIRQLFDYNELKELQFFIFCKENTIHILPTRAIDRWALKGILDQ